MICQFCFYFVYFFFFKQKTAYEMRISDWSSDVCSSDLNHQQHDGDNDRKARQDALAQGPVLHSISSRADQMPRSIAEAVPSFINGRSEERRVGKECVSTCRSRWSPYH